jgi:prephenate dehydratase
MRYSSPGPTPQSGDVMLRRTHDASRRYTLSTSEKAPQIACKTYEEAIAQADRFAQSQHVDVWKSDNDRAFTRIIECRVVSSV